MKLYILAFKDDKLRNWQPSSSPINVQIRSNTNCGYETISFKPRDPVVFSLNKNALPTEFPTVTPADAGTWDSSSYSCPVVQISIIDQFQSRQKGFLREPGFIGTGPYTPYQGAPTLMQPVDVTYPHCVTHQMYASTVRVNGDSNKISYCVCGLEKLSSSKEVVSIKLDQTIPGVTAPQQGVSSSGIYTYKAPEGFFVLDFSDPETSWACGVEKVQFYKDQQGTVLDDSRLTPTQDGALIDTTEPLDIQFYVGATTKGGVTAYKLVHVQVEKYDPCLNADVYLN